MTWIGVAHADPPALDAQGQAMLSPLREQALHPVELVKRLRLAPTASIVDLGAGPGYFTIALARAVPEGQVIAADIRDDYLEVARERAKAAGLRNVKTLRIAADHPALAPRSVDLVFLCQVDHYLGDRDAYFAALRPGLKPGGRIVLVNYQRHREANLAAARRVGLRVLDEWAPSPPFFVLVLAPEPR